MVEQLNKQIQSLSIQLENRTRECNELQIKVEELQRAVKRFEQAQTAVKADKKEKKNVPTD